MPEAKVSGFNSLKKPPRSGMPSKTMFLAELLLAFVFTRTPYINVPFNWLETYFHELSHALATLLTGGMVSHIELFINGAGLCFSQGGWPVVIGFSGYFGASLWGFLIFNIATWPTGIRTSFAILGALVVSTIIFWGRDVLTIAILIALAVLFFLPLKLSHSKVLTSSLRIVALMVLLNALSSPMVLLGMAGTGDAAMLANATLIPAWLWVGAWLVIAFGLLYKCWQRVRNASRNS